MKKNNIIKKNTDFSKIIKSGFKITNSIFNVYILENKKINKFGISISKKVGNAVKRNKFKRQIRSIIDSYDFNYDGYDIIFISRLNLKNAKYNDIKSEIFKVLDMIGEKYEKEKI